MIVARKTRRPGRTVAGGVVVVLALLGTLAALGLSACADDRAAPTDPSGEHPPGWADRDAGTFHAKWLAANKFPLSRCQQCHGADYKGGPTRVTCAKASCHSPDPPNACTTCHGSNGTPRPATGAHQAHIPYCDTCHKVPTTDEVEKHASAGPEAIINFSGLAVTGGKTPTWDRASGRCSNTYCHGALSPQWTDPAKIQCDSCHGAPPQSHQRWSRLTPNVDSCTTCHPGPTDPRHRNGVVDLLDGVNCSTCHGSSTRPSPPTALDGSTDPTSRGVGAHARHLDPTLPDRISNALACETCHQVPQSIREPGHYDSPQTRVRFVFGGSYDATTQSCNVWCHFGKTPGPVWTNASGSARACDGCHAFPPVTTRAGTPHPSVAGDVAVCKVCHLFDPSTHVDGVVEFVP
jgi:predicted CxxxxCH...CXXCH cytochrome family protein